MSNFVGPFLFLAAVAASSTVYADPLTVSIDAAGTYFPTSDPDFAGPPTTISLSNLDFYKSIPLSRQFVGLFSQGGFYYKLPDLGAVVPTAGLAAVFSSSVAGYVPPGPLGKTPQFVTIPTWAGDSSDIPQDFLVNAGSYSRFTAVQVPKSASSISFSVDDSFFSDNAGIGLKVTAFTLKDIVDSSSLDVSPNKLSNGQGLSAVHGAMTAIFTPDKIATADLTELSGYDHFNWLQIITGFSYNGTPTNVFDPNGTVVRATGLDPIPGTIGSDNVPLYWDETNKTRPGDFGDYYWDDHKDPLTFKDLPNLEVAGWSAEFSTYLVGVNADGSYDILANTLDDPDLMFRWRYDQLTDSKNGGGDVFFQNVDPALGGGGNVTFLGYGNVAVPELSTWTMIGLGFALVSLAGFRRSVGHTLGS